MFSQRKTLGASKSSWRSLSLEQVELEGPFQHGLMEWFGWKGPSNSSSPTPATGMDIFLFLNTPKSWFLLFLPFCPCFWIRLQGIFHNSLFQTKASELTSLPDPAAHYSLCLDLNYSQNNPIIFPALSHKPFLSVLCLCALVPFISIRADKYLVWYK